MNEKSIELEKKLEEIGFNDWENFGYWLLHSVLDYIDYWAWEITGDTPLEAYSSYNNIDFYDAVLDFGNKFTEIEIELLEAMPDEVYEKINAEYHRKLEIAIEELTKFYGETKIEE
jgi:hypothetical protein